MTGAVGWPLLAFLALCIAGIAAALLASEKLQGRLVAVTGAAASVALAWAGGAALIAGGDSTWRLWTIPSLGTITLTVDALAGLFLFVTALVTLTASLFVAPHLQRAAAGGGHPRSFAVGYLSLLVAIVGVLVGADVVSFLVAWELMSLLTFLLVHHEPPASRDTRAAYLMLAFGEAGAVAVALALLLMAARAGSLDFADLQAAARDLGPGTIWAAFLLSFFGFGVKAGLAPVNAWLPDAYAAAPIAFAPLLAGATLDLGIYGILRVDGSLLPMVSVGPGLLILIVGAVTALVGILYATTANDLKRLLAHSSIENAGIMTAGIGAGLVFVAARQPVLAGIAFIAALYHLINHSAYKTLLFMGAGTVETQSGTRDLDRLGGLVRRMPWTAAAFLVGALAIAALPPLNGFVSEWLTLQTMLASAALGSAAVKIVFALCGAALALTAALAVTCFVKAFAMAFLGVDRSPNARAAREAGWAGRTPAVLLAGCCLLLGVLPTYLIPVLDRVAHPLAGASAVTSLVPPFFSSDARHAELPPAFVADFADIGAQVGQRELPGPGLVIMHRGGESNPVVYAASPLWLLVVFASLLAVTWLVVRLLTRRRRPRTEHGPAWDGGVRRLLPEMTYTATGFSNPVRVVFHAVFRPTTIEDTRETVARHFRTAIQRERDEVHLIDRLVLLPLRRSALAFATLLGRLHHGLLNSYLAYVLIALLAALLLSPWL